MRQINGEAAMGSLIDTKGTRLTNEEHQSKPTLHRAFDPENKGPLSNTN